MPHKCTSGAEISWYLLLKRRFLHKKTRLNDKNSADAQAETAQAAEPDKVFDESVKQDKCSLLTPAQVAAAASVPESAVEKNRSLCLYEWDGHNIYLSSVRVHESIERASKYYERNTRDFTVKAIASSIVANLDEAG